MYISHQDVWELLAVVVFPAIIYVLSFLYSWKSICNEIKETGRDFTRLQFVGRILSINFLVAFCVYVLFVIYTYVTSIGFEYGGEFAVALLTIFAFFIYIGQAVIIFVVTLLVFPFVKKKLTAIRADTQLNSAKFTQPISPLSITIATKILLTIFVIIGITVYFLFYS